MKFDIRIPINVVSPKQCWSTIEAEDIVAAEKIAKEIADDIIANPPKVEVLVPRVTISDKNYTLITGAIYEVKRYNKYVPAVCDSSWKTYGDKEYVHTLAYLNSGKSVILYGKKPPKLGKMICADGKVGEQCTNCSARFICTTGSRRD